MSGVARWEDPPPMGRSLGRQPGPKRSGQWAEAARQLRERPGEWGVVATAETHATTHADLLGYSGMIKSGRLAAFRPAGSFEATTRTVEGAVYARYVGDPS